jgi:hypothetical protein
MALVARRPLLSFFMLGAASRFNRFKFVSVR